jgi:hypothetical protein
MAAAAGGKTYINQRGRGGRAKGNPQIRWDTVAIMKLTAILANKPIPSNRKIALEMGVSLQALQRRCPVSTCRRTRARKRSSGKSIARTCRVKTTGGCATASAAKSHSAAKGTTTVGCSNTDGLIDVTECELGV